MQPGHRTMKRSFPHFYNVHYAVELGDGLRVSGSQAVRSETPDGARTLILANLNSAYPKARSIYIQQIRKVIK